jgi:hypothetical protein
MICLPCGSANRDVRKLDDHRSIFDLPKMAKVERLKSRPQVSEIGTSETTTRDNAQKRGHNIDIVREQHPHRRTERHPYVSPDEIFRDVARIALTVATKHGFVLGGGVAWLVNGLVDRPTEDVDLFTDTAGGVEAAAGEVATALTEAGYRVVREEGDDLFAGMSADIQEFLVATDDRALRLTLCRLDRQNKPVVMDLGPVMHLDDLVATKVAALVNRREVRDYIDVAAALERYPLDRILALARTADPALDPEDIADAGRYLDRLDDARFTLYGLTPDNIATLRQRLANWPRTPSI